MLRALPSRMAAVVALIAVAAGCDQLMGTPAPTPSAPTCIDVAPGRDVLGHQFVSSGPVDAKIRSYVEASNDLAGAANQVEAEVAQSCFRIGLDLGVTAGAMQPRIENGGKATGACFAAAQALDGAMRSGATVWVRVTAPFCTPNAFAQNQCAAVCNVNPGDPECNASCRVHASVSATCTPPIVLVTPSSTNPMSIRLATTLQANLPGLVHADLALGRRLANDAQILGQIGANLPRMIGQSGALAVGCVGAASNQAQAASWQMQVSLRASALITGRVGATSG
jgi:hypothetical protein